MIKKSIYKNIIIQGLLKYFDNKLNLEVLKYSKILDFEYISSTIHQNIIE